MFIPLSALENIPMHISVLSPITSPHDGPEDIIFLPPSESHGQAGCVPVSDYCGWEWALLSTECWLYPLVSPPHCHYRPRVPAQPGLSLERRPMESLARRSDRPHLILTCIEKSSKPSCPVFMTCGRK